MKPSLITERLSELGSACVTIDSGQIYLKGFLSEDRLHDYYDNDIDCFFCEGIYPLAEIRPHFMPDDALLLIRDAGSEQKSKFVVDERKRIEYQSTEFKSKSKRLCKFRRDVYSGHLNYVDGEVNLLYETPEDLDRQLTAHYGPYRFLPFEKV